ncbi:MAG: sigma-70 family RNA polymerase sigma factor [Nannocystaceae bacterium]
MISDTELLQVWRDGDEARGQELCKRYFEPVARFFANKLGDHNGDLVQDTFLAVVQGRDRISDDARFRSYLFGVAYNVLKKHLKRRYRLPEDFVSRSLHDIAPGIETMLREAEHLHLLKAALRRIPLELQVALELRYWESLSSAEIGQILGVPSSTVRTHLGRARALLEQALRSEDAEPQMIESTISNLDAWAQQLRAAVVKAPASARRR